MTWTMIVILYLGSSAAQSFVVPRFASLESCEKAQDDLNRTLMARAGIRPSYSTCVETAP